MFSLLDKDTLSELVANSLTAADSIFFSYNATNVVCGV